MKVVFLDIDGVLQPLSKKVRVNYINNDIISLLNNKYHINYNRYDIKDVSRVYYDWDKSAIERLRKILSVTDSKIIISSNWRDENKPNKMHDLLKIHTILSFSISIVLSIICKFILKSPELPSLLLVE